jgi:hypothetical protein
MIMTASRGEIREGCEAYEAHIREVIYEMYPVYFVSSLQNKFRGTAIDVSR